MVCLNSDLDWFGSHGMLFIVNRLIENEVDKHALESRCVAHESSLDTEMSLNRSLRRQLTQTQRASQDNDWRLQEQLVAVTNDLQHERNLSEQLREQIIILETQAEHNETASISNFGEFSPTNSVSIATTPAQTWRDQTRRSLSSTWSGSQQADKLLKVAEKLNITPNHDDDNVM